MDLLSVDENCHIFIWQYDPQYIINASQMFRPAFKYRIPLKSKILDCVAIQELKPTNASEDFNEIAL